MNLKDLAHSLGAELQGPGNLDISGVAGIREAGDGDITFLADEKQLKDLEQCKASAVIVPLAAPSVGLPSLRVKNPRLAFARALALFYLAPYAPSGVSDKATIARDAVIGSDASIHPYAVVDEGVKIGNRATLYPGVYVGRGSIIGDDCLIYPQVTIREGVRIGNRVIIHAGTVIGSDGFGFVTDGGRHHKIPQVGGVIIEDDVEIGGNCTVDRATLGNTIIKEGTKLDNQVHVAHNVTIGQHCLLAGQAGVAGSTTLGNYVIVGGRTAIGDHLRIGDNVMVSGGSGVMKNTESGQVVGGYYAMPQREWLRVQAVLPKLPELKKNVTSLERRIQELEEQIRKKGGL